MKWIFFVSLILFNPFFVQAQKNNSVQYLIQKKLAFDSLRLVYQNELIVLVKMEGDSVLKKILTQEFPNSGIECTYNILKDNQGNILLISVYPFSISGDWFVGFTHNFDEQGKTFAFERLTSFYNSGCTEDMASERIIKYFNSDFIEVKETYSLTGLNNIPLKKSKCELLYEFEYTVYKNADEVLKFNTIPK